MEQYQYKGVGVVADIHKTSVHLTFLSSESNPSTQIWNDILKILCKKNEIIGDSIYDPETNEFIIQVKTIKNVESAFELCKEKPEFQTANFYINGELFRFNYLRTPTEITINGKNHKTIGEFTLPKTAYQRFRKQ